MYISTRKITNQFHISRITKKNTNNNNNKRKFLAISGGYLLDVNVHY